MLQVFIISMQSFTALDISSQALVASYLGRVSLSQETLVPVLFIRSMTHMPLCSASREISYPLCHACCLKKSGKGVRDLGSGITRGCIPSAIDRQRCAVPHLNLFNRTSSEEVATKKDISGLKVKKALTHQQGALRVPSLCVCRGTGPWHVMCCSGRCSWALLWAA